MPADTFTLRIMHPTKKIIKRKEAEFRLRAENSNIAFFQNSSPQIQPQPL